MPAQISAVRAPAPWRVSHYENVLGTSLELKFAAATEAEAGRAEAAALAEIGRLDKILSGYDATSEFRQWLASTHEARRVSPELFEVLQLFDRWRERTDGALDAAAEVTGRLWREAERTQNEPAATDIAAAVAATRESHWRLDPMARTATHLSSAPLILNSFAKSYIIDRACDAALATGGIEAAVINIGGDLVVRGARGEEVGIADPGADAENDGPTARIAVRDRAVATSGGYRRGGEIEGRWYSHLVDPRTGRPVAHVRSATVVARDPVEAGALATAFCVLTPEESLHLAAARPGVECLLLTADGRRLASAGWAAMELPVSRGNHGVFARLAGEADATNAAGGPAAGPGFELLVNLEIARIGRIGAKRPFVAVWIQDKDGFPLRTIALWYHGDRWLSELSLWMRADHIRSLAEGDRSIADSVSSATRNAGKYTLRWDGRDNAGKPVPAGKYTVMIEAAREHGTRQSFRREIDFAGPDQKIELDGGVELTAASLELHHPAAKP